MTEEKINTDFDYYQLQVGKNRLCFHLTIDPIYYLYVDTVFDSVKNEINIRADTVIEMGKPILKCFYLNKTSTGIYFQYYNEELDTNFTVKWYSLIAGDTTIVCDPFSIERSGVSCGGDSYFTGRDTLIRISNEEYAALIINEIHQKASVDGQAFIRTTYVEKKTGIPILIRARSISTNSYDRQFISTIYLSNIAKSSRTKRTSD